eukprot:gene11490-13400_t
MSTQYKVVALDLDGTLLNSDKKVSDNTKRVLMHLEKTRPDVDIILASGRAPYLLTPTETSAGIDCALIGYNGGICLSKKRDGRVVNFHKAIPSDQLAAIFSYVEDHSLYLNVYGDGIVYGVTKDRIKADNYAMMTGATYCFVDSYRGLVGKVEPTKCLIILDKNEECDQLMATLTPLFPGVSLVKSNCHSHTCKQYYVEFLQRGVNKGTSVREYCEAKGVDMKDVVAFGDAENDIDMLQHAGMGICLANGTDATKREATRVSQFTNDQDGVARELVAIYNLPADLLQ